MFKLLVLVLATNSQDSIIRDSVPSLVFLPTKEIAKMDLIEYRHQQGFFCDFEDRINKGRKVNLNLGVGEQ